MVIFFFNFHCFNRCFRYRQAPEYTHPAAFNDCFAVTAAIADSDGSELGVDPKILSVGGDSAGGNMAATVAIAWRETNRPNLRSQVLIYPVLQMLRFSFPSHLEVDPWQGMTVPLCSFAYSYYLFGHPNFQVELRTNSTLLLPEKTWRAVHEQLSGKVVDIPVPPAEEYPHAAILLSTNTSPLLAKNLSGVAPATIFLSHYDMLRSEGELYADRLREEGVEVDVTTYRWQTHGFAAGPTLPLKSFFLWLLTNSDADEVIHKIAGFVHRQIG